MATTVLLQRSNEVKGQKSAFLAFFVSPQCIFMLKFVLMDTNFAQVLSFWQMYVHWCLSLYIITILSCWSHDQRSKVTLNLTFWTISSITMDMYMAGTWKGYHIRGYIKNNKILWLPWQPQSYFRGQMRSNVKNQHFWLFCVTTM